MYIDKLDRHFQTALDEGLSEEDAEKGIANYMGCFLLTLVDKKLFDNEIYTEEYLNKMESYLDKKIIEVDKYFDFFFDCKISESCFNENGLKFVKEYYQSFKYLEDYIKVFKMKDDLIFSNITINKRDFFKLKEIVDKKYNKKYGFLGNLFKKFK